MVTIAPAAQVQGAVRAPLPFGLFSTFNLRPEADGRWQSGVAFSVDTCAGLGGIGQADCTTTFGLPKTLTSLDLDQGAASAFTVYGHFTCAPVGYSSAEAQDKATSHLVAREEAAVEEALWTGSLGNTPKLADIGHTTSLAGGAAQSPVVAIALLEQHVATVYGSLGVLHMDRRMASALLSIEILVVAGQRLTTKLGTPVVAGAGYPGTGPAAEAITNLTGWVYVTPGLFGYRGDVFTSTRTPGDLFDRGQNTLYAIAERTYLVGYDTCGVGAAQVTLA